MGWFFLGLLMAIGGIWTAWKRSKRTPVSKAPKDKDQR